MGYDAQKKSIRHETAMRHFSSHNTNDLGRAQHQNQNPTCEKRLSVSDWMKFIAALFGLTGR
jgi:hypothetical protein